MNIVLFGFKRCGKTYFGKKLAAKHSVAFMDTDDLIIKLYFATTNKTLTAKEIFQQVGALNFRALEREIVQSLQNVQNTIISVGGGAFLDDANVQLLEKYGKLVYLDVPKEVLKERTLSGELPAYLDPANPEASFDIMYEQRLPIYERIPAHRIDTTGRTEKEILNLLSEILEGKTHGE